MTSQVIRVVYGKVNEIGGPVIPGRSRLLGHR